jgi:hypothetical protein
MKKIILSGICVVVYNVSVHATTPSIDVSHEHSDHKTLKANDKIHYGEILSEWSALKTYDADHPIDLSRFTMLKKESWTQYTIEKFKTIPEFKQEKSIAIIKKIFLQMLLTRNVPLSVITNFLTTAEAGSVWRTILDDMIHQSKFLHLQAVDMAQVIHTLMTMPLSVIDRKGLVLPIPDAYQEKFSEFYDQQAMNGATPKCLQKNTPPAPKPTDSPSNPGTQKLGADDAKHFSIHAEDVDCFTHWVSVLTQAYLTTLSDVDGLKKLTARANLDALNQRILREIDAAMNQHDHSNDNNGSRESDESDQSSSNFSGGSSSHSSSSASSGSSPSSSSEYHFDSEFISKTFEPEKEEVPVTFARKTRNFLDQLKGKKAAS